MTLSWQCKNKRKTENQTNHNCVTTFKVVKTTPTVADRGEINATQTKRWQKNKIDKKKEKRRSSSSKKRKKKKKRKMKQKKQKNKQKQKQQKKKKKKRDEQ